MVSERLSGGPNTAASEIAHWRADLAIDRAVKRGRSSEAAALAARRARQAVGTAAEWSALVLPDPHVTLVARAAGELARGILVCSQVPEAVALFLDPWDGVLPQPATDFVAAEEVPTAHARRAG
ncbi:MAG: hypothetical protein AB1679_14470 [Actinomycetota bacterium]